MELTFLGTLTKYEAKILKYFDKLAGGTFQNDLSKIERLTEGVEDLFTFNFKGWNPVNNDKIKELLKFMANIPLTPLGIDLFPSTINPNFEDALDEATNKIKKKYWDEGTDPRTNPKALEEIGETANFLNELRTYQNRPTNLEAAIEGMTPDLNPRGAIPITDTELEKQITKPQNSEDRNENTKNFISFLKDLGEE